MDRRLREQGPAAGRDDELASRISVEQTRSAAIRAQIERLAQGSDQLAGIIAMANRMADSDEVSADALRAELADARTRLTQMRPAPEPTPAPTPARRTTTAPDDNDHERGRADGRAGAR